MFLESETSQFKYLPNCNSCENLSLVHLLTCCSLMGESGGKGVESPLYFLFIRRPLSLSCLQNIPEMHALQTCFLAWWTGPHRPLHLALLYHLSQHLSHASHPGENLKIVEGLKRTLESEFDASLVEKMFIPRIISLQVVHTCELTKSPCFREILAKEETRGSSGKQTLKESQLPFGKYHPFFQACCPHEIQSASCRCLPGSHFPAEVWAGQDVAQEQSRQAGDEWRPGSLRLPNLSVCGQVPLPWGFACYPWSRERFKMPSNSKKTYT